MRIMFTRNSIHVFPKLTIAVKKHGILVFLGWLLIDGHILFKLREQNEIR